MNIQVKYLTTTLIAIIVFSLVYEMVKFLFAYLLIYLSWHAINIGLKDNSVELIIKLIAGIFGIFAAILSFKASLHGKTFRLYRRPRQE